MTTIQENIKALAIHIEQMIEMAAAKIIKEVCEKVDESKCGCMEKIEEINKQVTIGKEATAEGNTPTGLQKYSYPNNMVGNEEFGSSKNSQSLIWPFGLEK